MAKRVTIADVAAEAGLSKTAVSMILNDRPGTGLSAETAKRVRAIAHRLNYRPDPSARALRMGTTPTIGFVSDDVTLTRYASAMIRGILDVAEENDHTVLLAETGQHPERLAGSLDAMLDRRVSALVFGSMAARRVELPELPSDVPVVMVNATTTADYPAVLPDERTAGAAIAQLLIDAGHTRIALIGRRYDEDLPPEVSVTISDRFAGLDAVMAEHGLSWAWEEAFETWSPENGYEATRRALASGADFTALVCLTDNVSFGAYQALQEQGVRIPEQVSIASFDDDEISTYLRPQLTTARLPYEEMGRTAMALALAGTTTGGRHLVPMPIVERASVRRVE
ncbi:LacI family DNA-binding transcriptional regulator [Leifsonia sp. F6_8S_P_1B]|uniref:LacI family DNA-binding transcriptional regulator n=1 Tax=Leifsonia williamsii TaxID=3035919 RepID=A0ABT8K9F9_9MICO|nr:LacI family DNA-binding transcriptional regulator [Leifsonia williamsii]MDN4614093.1 LacI family DNA-binding transcriptional regulator [Leifsonia williamsii]